MKNVLLVVIGAIFGALVVYMILPKVEENSDEVHVLDKAYSFNTGQSIDVKQAKKLYKTYITQNVEKSKYSVNRKGRYMNNQDKERYLDLDSNAISGIRLVQSIISPSKPDTVGLRLFLGIQKQSSSDTDYVYIATYIGAKKSKDDDSQSSVKYYIIDIEDKKSPTCPIECDNRDYENPF